MKYLCVGTVVALISELAIVGCCAISGNYVRGITGRKPWFKYRLKGNFRNILKAIVLEVVVFTPMQILLWPIRVIDWLFLLGGAIVSPKSVKKVMEETSSDWTD